MSVATALITGGQGNLAQALVQELHAAGLNVLAPSRVQLDVCDPHSVAQFFRSHAGTPVELLVNNAGITSDTLIARLTSEHWDRVVSTSLDGAWRCSRAFVKSLRERNATAGHVVNIASFAAFDGPYGLSAYAAAKAGMIGLTQSLAAEEGPHNVRANAILPGFLKTRMTQDLDPAVVERARKHHVLGRFNTPESVARFLTVLHHDLTHVSGQVFQLDSRLRRQGW